MSDEKIKTRVLTIVTPFFSFVISFDWILIPIKFPWPLSKWHFEWEKDPPDIEVVSKEEA